MTVAASYLKAHMVRVHGICVPQMRGIDDVGGGPTTYVMSFPKVIKEVRCPVPGCPAVHTAQEDFANTSCFVTSDPR